MREGADLPRSCPDAATRCVTIFRQRCIRPATIGIR